MSGKGKGAYSALDYGKPIDANFVLHIRHLLGRVNLIRDCQRFERNRPLATLLMILLLGRNPAAVLKQLMP